MRQFFLAYPRGSSLVEKRSAPPSESTSSTIRSALPSESGLGPFPQQLGWTHYLLLMRVSNPSARAFYEVEATQEAWTARELERQIASLLFERLAKSRNKAKVRALARRADPDGPLPVVPPHGGRPARRADPRAGRSGADAALDRQTARRRGRCSEGPLMDRDQLQAARDRVLTQVLAHVENQDPLLVLKAPPGSGKTYVTMRAVALANHRGLAVAVATQTNNQANDFCRRMAIDFPETPVVRFASGRSASEDLGKRVKWVTTAKELPEEPAIVVGTTAKLVASALPQPFDYLFIDEAWQMCWADFMLMSQLSPRFVLVGDPGQIAPVVSIDVSRWETSRRPPHVAAPTVLLRDLTLPLRSLYLPVTTRLPYDTTQLLQSFYDFEFESWAMPGERVLDVSKAKPGVSSGVDGAIDLLTTGSVSMLTLPTPTSGPPLEDDPEVAEAVAQVVKRLLERKAKYSDGKEATVLKAAEIGVSASHRVMNSRLADALGDLYGSVAVDTPARWQGLEREMMVVVHPLSGVTEPSSFDLATGRLCVMASRHKVGLVMVSRDHIGDTLEEYLPVADQAVGLPDEAGRGHAQNWAVWEWLSAAKRIAEM